METHSPCSQLPAATDNGWASFDGHVVDVYYVRSAQEEGCGEALGWRGVDSSGATIPF